MDEGITSRKNQLQESMMGEETSILVTPTTPFKRWQSTQRTWGWLPWGLAAWSVSQLHQWDKRAGERRLWLPVQSKGTGCLPLCSREFAEEALVTHPNLYTAKQTHKMCIAVISTTLVKREEGRKNKGREEENDGLGCQTTCYSPCSLTPVTLFYNYRFSTWPLKEKQESKAFNLITHLTSLTLTQPDRTSRQPKTECRSSGRQELMPQIWDCCPCRPTVTPHSTIAPEMGIIQPLATWKGSTDGTYRRQVLGYRE